jgi:membrane protein involved in colicin uptake
VQQEEFKLNKKQRQKLLREKQFKEKQAEELKKQQEEQKKAQEEAQNNPNPESSTTEEAPKVDAEDTSSQPEANATTVDTKTEEAPKDQAEGASKSDTTAEQQQVPENATSESAASGEKKEESHATPTEPKDTETAVVEAKEQTKGKSGTNAKKPQEQGKNNNGKAEPKNDWDDLPEDNVPPMMSQVDGRHVKEVPTGCSVQSTLYAFTAPEMLDSDNAFSCYNCTKLHWVGISHVLLSSVLILYC